MQITSEAETSARQTGRALELLPALSRWLTRSLPERRQADRPYLPLSQLRLLVHVAWRGPTTVGEIARDLGISCSTATECIAELESRGRVVKQRSESDRRRVIVSLTPQAEEYTGRVLRERRAVVEEAFHSLTPKECRTFLKGLALLAGIAESRLEAMSRGEGKAGA